MSQQLLSRSSKVCAALHDVAEELQFYASAMNVLGLTKAAGELEYNANKLLSLSREVAGMVSDEIDADLEASRQSAMSTLAAALNRPPRTPGEL